VDPVSLDSFVFDGILGTNYLMGSGDLSALSGFPVPFREGPFEWLVLDLDATPPSLGVVFPSIASVPVTSLPGVLAASLIVATRLVLRRRRPADPSRP
jgi:hypothetical protein